MRNQWITRIGIGAFALIGALTSLATDTRLFTSTDGRRIEAQVVTITGAQVTLKRVGVGNVNVPINRLVEADRKYLEEWAIEEAKNRIPKVDIKINSNKRDTRQKGSYEDREGQFQFEIGVENEERGFDIIDASATLLVLGDYLTYKDEGIVMERNDFKKFSVKDGKTTMLVGKLTKYEYDKDDYTHGQKYSGYIFVMRNSAGKVVKVQGSTPRLEKHWQLLIDFKMAERYDQGSLKKIDTSLGRSVLN